MSSHVEINYIFGIPELYQFIQLSRSSYRLKIYVYSLMSVSISLDFITEYFPFSVNAKGRTSAFSYKNAVVEKAGCN